ncbi:bifunctional 2',3'-cyclic-nucleotide 2'-phosphodiesterase/3'-nucleotidase [Natroniella sulfidigena]|uniref:bifunctional 2',3'-cyclic-nucleotide 2'-phosphodiesterase/3'-nucleotidase n=1 Tax=Natroniella sulfidigena TaxID=723921 RepID=UPI00200B4819|nr:bifunctional 2',3'-cyclic-nucleotide 2'-phosphodiesterase/3'-nucleotidase [Natroniella sulfidigena]MCK8817554.1 bifunctional 2',3'-cyclic-nucleotide 2'-phosphodiesterase/3'-nucleotidase [Natroniella sulfidigena]
MDKENKGNSKEIKEQLETSQQKKGISRRKFLANTGKVLAGTVVTGLGFSSFNRTAKGFSSAPLSSEHKLTLLSTTDLHQYIMPYSYMSNEADENIGLSKVATLVEEIKKKHDNVLLFDSGDVIQGSLLGNLEADQLPGDVEPIVSPLDEDEHPTIVDSMNAMGYDAATLGNHELQDYGIDYFRRAEAGSDFPWLNANLYDYDNPEENYFTPYVILDREIDGKEVNIGVVGFVSPEVVSWGSTYLEGEVVGKDIIEEAEKVIPQMKEEGADLIIVSAHTGIDPDDKDVNAGYYLSQVEGIDAMVLGHQHNEFPGGSEYDDIENIDNEQGLINGVPTAMPGAWGSHLGVVELDVVYNGGDWEVKGGKSRILDVDEEVKKHPEIVGLVEEKHEATIDYVTTPIGETAVLLSTHFTRVKDSAIITLTQEAQKWYTEEVLELTKKEEYKDLPVISTAAPLRFGRQGPTDYTYIEPGKLDITDITDIYIYDNLFQVVKVTGAELVEFLEESAENFNQIDPDLEEDQELINEYFEGFYYESILGIDYKIDVTQKVGNRIVDVTYKGQPVTDDMEFLMATNNHRASGTATDVLDGSQSLLPAAPGDVKNQDVIMEYVAEKDVIAPERESNWELKPVETKGDIIFASDPVGREYMEDKDLARIEFAGTDDNEWGIYKYLLNQDS